MIDDWLAKSFVQVLRAIGSGPPKSLISRVQPDAEDHGVQISAKDLTALIDVASTSDPLLSTLGQCVHRWDAETTSDWTDGTRPSTQERRSLICSKLGLDETGAALLLKKRPIYVDQTIVITAPWNRWYTADRADSRSFYWPHYRDYLLKVRKWPEKSVTDLDLATTHVVERLADPTRVEAYQSKGLVVGYVQSGKTANFTGVIAKAIDAGYRLVIVMTGTIEMLRAQTQRRMDMELVGKKNIVGDLTPEEALAAKVDYQDDNDWERFQDFSGELVPTGINRLTLHKRDYQDQFLGLKIERFDGTKPLYDPANLYPIAARLVVTKKNDKVLKKLVANVKATKKVFAEVPVLIIDDESDQASVNTINPEKQNSKEEKERRAINGHIADLLQLMPRAQYVGYTATPFANVFVDPSDPMDIYPKDFLISLPEPNGYMGVKDFHDLTSIPEPADCSSSNYAAFVRDLLASETADDEVEREKELARAIDMFVLTGACKLYRTEELGVDEFKHHTMLVHESVGKSDQKELASVIRRIWQQAGFSMPAGLKRLRDLYVSDVLPVSNARRESDELALPDFDAIKAYIGKSVSRITEHDNNPVLVVNSDKEVQLQQQDLDFDRNRIWRILVGGAKLSRGFTVEGLTVTYFRRSTRMSDSLTQMGRWFGYRQGYRDLVRLYIDRNAKFGRKRVDLYKAFEAVALDEAAFRAQLSMYAEWDGEKPKVLPSQIPPLVSQHLPWLKPTARNKMFNAVLEEQGEKVVAPSGYPFHLVEQEENLDLWRPLLSECSDDILFPAGGALSLRAFSGIVDAGRIVDLVDKMHWMYEYKQRWLHPRLAYMRRVLQMSNAPLKDFLVVLPQPNTAVEHIHGVGSRRIINRDRRDRGGELIQKFGEITDPKHRDLLLPLVRLGKPKGHPLAEFWAPNRGACLVYLVREQKPQFGKSTLAKAPKGSSNERGLIVAFTLYLPNQAVGHDLVPKFRVLLPDELGATVDVQDLPKPAAVTD